MSLLKRRWLSLQVLNTATPLSALFSQRAAASTLSSNTPPVNAAAAGTQRAQQQQTSLDRVCDAIYRSATSREALRLAVHEPSHESALRLLREFQRDPGVWRDTKWVADFTAASPRLLAQMELVLTRFAQWHTVRKVPAKVAMHEPWEWYPQARLSRRTFIFHHGPTNSGKTHAALQAMMAARSGVYCAPLKALAAQVWHRVNARVPCDLLIGDERVFAGGAEHVSCTVEMAPVDQQVDVAVIDEVQMIGDRERGWAWTRALLGMPAREIHLCGEQRALPLVERLLRATREERRLVCEAHTRLVPLVVSPCLSGSLRADVQNGDCFVCFSKKKVLELQARLNRIPGVQSSAIYGAMPFQVREREAARFNDGASESVSSGTAAAQSPPAVPPRRVLVSTDAIAYGLNMNIERVIFTTMRKFDGKEVIPLPPHTIQQIAGRAGRFGLARQNAEGRCTAMQARDMPLLQEAMTARLPSLSAAGLLPTADVLQLFVELEQTRARKAGVKCTDSFHELMTKFAAACEASPLFFPCDMQRSLLRLAELLEPVRDLTLTDRILFCYLPLSDTSAESLQLVVAYAAEHAKGNEVPMQFDGACRTLLSQVQRRKHDLTKEEWAARCDGVTASLERMFRQAEMYCWLSWRFGKTFSQREEGLQLKAAIAAALSELSAERV